MSSVDTRTLAEVAQGLAAETESGGVAGRATKYALELTTASDGGLDVLHDDRLEHAVASSKRVASAGQIQELVGEGPCFDTARRGETLLVQDAAKDTRWPLWGPAVAELGLNCMISAPLDTGDGEAGAMYVFSSEPRNFDEDDADNMRLLQAHVTVALRSIRRQETLRHDMEVRNLIGQAQGILMEHYELDAQSAADLLLEAARRAKLDLQTVAEDVVSTGELRDRG